MLLLASLATGAAQAAVAAQAGSAAVPSLSRLAGDWQSSPLVVLRGSRPVASLGSVDLGAASPNQALGRMILLLSPSAAQKQALSTELANLQDPTSPFYHQWLSASAFADAYSVSASDAASVAAWLTAQGFQVAALPAGRGWIEFSGTVAQAEQAFNAPLHSFSSANGLPRTILIGDISVPAALQPVVAGLVSLDGVITTPALTTPQPLTIAVADLAALTSPATAPALTPQLAAELLNLQPLTSAGVTGAGQSIAIASRSNVNAADIAAFRAAFGLPESPLTVTLAGADPGLTDAQPGATLAASWAGAAAPGAQILLVPAASTSATDGVDISLAAIVDQQLANTAVAAYSACEASLSPAHQTFYSALYQQAAAEGITIIAAAGDSGPAACFLPGSATPVTTGYGVNALSSTPWNTSVGVAAFASSSAALSAWSPAATAEPAYAGGGGVSSLYAIPHWQPIPTQFQASASTPNRLLPDLSLPTAIDSVSNPGLAFCLTAPNSNNSGCTLVRSGGSAAAASLFAGIAALAAQKYGLLGNLAPSLYLASLHTGTFSDVSQGSAQLACAAGSPGCASGQIGYTATAGYDLATGLGVPNATQLVAALVQPSVGNGATSVSLQVTPTATNNTYNPTASITFTGTVLSQTGGGVPTGTVTFYDMSSSAPLASPVTLNGSGVGTATVEGVFPNGGNLVVAQYSGDTTYAANASTPPVNLNVQASTVSLTVTPSTTSAASGQTITALVTLTVGTPAAGTVNPAGVITLNVDGGAESYNAALSTTTTGGVSVTTANFGAVVMPASSSQSTHTLQAIYNGNAYYNQATSPQVTIDVTQSTPNITLTPATTTPTSESPLLVTVTVAPTISGSTPPTGTVTFKLDGGTLTTANITAGSPSTATATITTPGGTGNHSLQAVYNGDANYAPVNSSVATLTVSKTPTVTTVFPATNSPAPGAALLVYATVTPVEVAAAPTGTITFTVDGTTVGSTTMTTGTSPSITITAPTSGSHPLVAIYSGDSNYIGSSSSPVILVNSKIGTTTVDTPSTFTPPAGGTLNVITTITPASYGAAQPTGTVSYTLDGVTQATANVVSGAPATASTSFTVPSSGSHTLIALYSGDSIYGSSASSAATLTISKPSTTIALVPASSTPASGSSLQLTATVTPSASASSQPTGLVTFTLDGTTIGTAPLSATSTDIATFTFTVPSTGTHSLQASYPGDTNYTGSTSSSVPISIAKNSATILLTPASTSLTAGGTLLMNVTLTPTGTGAASPTGFVNFLVDNVTVGTGLVVAGSPSTASLTVATPSIGTHSLQAVYSGDGNYGTVTSSAVSVLVSKGTTTLTVTPATTAPTGSSLMVVTATLAATTSGSVAPTGSVLFTLDGVTVATSPLVSGSTAQATITVPSTGTHNLQASYAGDSNYTGSVAPTVAFTVARTPTTLVVTPSTTAPTLGTTVPVTATLTATATNQSLPTGTITFLVDGVATSYQPLVSGSPSTATYIIPALTSGAHTISGTYSGDTYYAGVNSAAVPVTVAKIATSTAVTTSSTSLASGVPLQVSATITAASNIGTLPTGTVTFALDGVSAGSATVVNGTSSTATIAASALTPGTHTLTATYGGDTNYSTSVSTATTTVTIAKASTTTTVSATTLTATVGGSVVATATITPGTVLSVNPTGTVTFTLDGVAAGSATVNPGNPSTASATITVPAAGSHILLATYSGDTSFLTSSAATGVTLIVAKGATTTTLAATPAIMIAGTKESLSATVAPVNAVTGTTYTITGTVAFYDGAVLLGQATLVGNVATLNGLALANNIDHNIKAVYSGDSNWITSTSSTLLLAATTLPDYVVLTANYSVVPPGAALVLTATVNPSSVPLLTGEQNPTGTVIFYNGTTIIGSAALVAVPLTDTSTATLTIQTLPPGQDTIYAFYEGDLSYDAADSNLITLTVQGFTITPSLGNPGTNLNIVQGSSGSESFDITGTGGFNGAIQILCTPPSQDNMTCTASPQQLTPPGTVTFTVQTTKNANLVVAKNSPPFSPFLPRAAGGTAFAALLFFLLPYGRRARTFLGRAPYRAFIFVLLFVGLGATGIGCTNNNAVAPFGTPLGVATIKVTATIYVDNTVVSKSIYFTVNVTAS